jgi:hypothetical protein
MIKWLMRLSVPFVLLGLTACGGQTSKIPQGSPDTKAKMETPPAPPSLPKGPPKDAPPR